MQPGRSRRLCGVPRVRWKELDAEGRQPYEAKAAADKERYMSEMKAFKEKKRAEQAGDDEDDEEEEAPAEEAGAGNDDDDEE